MQTMNYSEARQNLAAALETAALGTPKNSNVINKQRWMPNLPPSWLFMAMKSGNLPINDNSVYLSGRDNSFS